MVLGLGLWPSGAEASPWTLRRGQVVVGANSDFQFANTEFFGLEGEPTGERIFPLNGEYFAGSVRVGVRAGFLDEFELELSAPLQLVSYRSDPVIILPQPEDSVESSLDYYQRNVLDLSRVAAGVGDIVIAGRYRWLLQPFALSTELRIKAPTGYAGPAGTFGDRPRNAEELGSDPVRFVSPENVTDDVTLGDAQLDMALIMHAGVAFDTRTFVRAELGYNLRFGGAGHQLLAALRAGQLIEDVVLLYGGVSLALSVTEGRTIGVSVAAEDPSLPARDYGGLNNLLLREVPLQYDALQVGGGAIIRVTQGVELNFGFYRTVWGRNVAAVNGVSIGIGVQTDYAPEREAIERAVRGEERAPPEPEPEIEDAYEPEPESEPESDALYPDPYAEPIGSPDPSVDPPR